MVITTELYSILFMYVSEHACMYVFKNLFINFYHVCNV